jgi:hypothetical protein
LRSGYPSIRPSVIIDNTIVDNTSIKGLEERVVYSSSRLIINGILIVSRVRSLDSYIVVGYKGLILYSNSWEGFSKVSVLLLLRALKRIHFSRGLDRLSITRYLAIGFKGYIYKIILEWVLGLNLRDSSWTDIGCFSII